jgi:predicted nuclease of restriction endonuclease-like RecB superfamily
MLTKDLLRYRIDDGRISPSFLDPGSPRYSQAARDLIAIFSEHIGKTLGELEEAIEKYAASRTDYRILRGLAKVLMGFAEFETRRSDAAAIREAVFERAAGSWPVVRRKGSPLGADRYSILEEVAAGAGLSAAQLEEELYADLPERRRLASFAARREPEALIARYNMELARGLLYWAERLVIDVEDSYQDVFRYIKLCRLMSAVTRRESGYRIELDGPLSLLRGTFRYGLKMAVFLPALALCRTWRMEAVIVKKGERLNFALDDQSRLVSHFRRFPLFDSRLESDFAADFQKAFERRLHAWRLARADAVIPLERNEVMIPDFTLRNQNGREVYLEIVGFWTPEYLSRKIAKVRAARLDNLILAVSKRLALGEETAKELDVLWFAGRLSAADVIERADLLAGGTEGQKDGETERQRE